MREATSGSTRQEQERSRLTRQKLMAATIKVLAEQGWSGATIGGVAKKAGVSRGACQHHFPTRTALVSAAVEHVFREQVEELARRAKSLPKSRRKLEPLLNLLAEVYAGPLFTAATQLWVAAVADAELKALLLPLETNVGRQVHRLTVELLGLDERDREVRRGRARHARSPAGLGPGEPAAGRLGAAPQGDCPLGASARSAVEPRLTQVSGRCSSRQPGPTRCWSWPPVARRQGAAPGARRGARGATRREPWPADRSGWTKRRPRRAGLR